MYNSIFIYINSPKIIFLFILVVVAEHYLLSFELSLFFIYIMYIIWILP